MHLPKFLQIMLQKKINKSKLKLYMHGKQDNVEDCNIFLSLICEITRHVRVLNCNSTTKKRNEFSISLLLLIPYELDEKQDGKI